MKITLLRSHYQNSMAECLRYGQVLNEEAGSQLLLPILLQSRH